MLIPYVGYAKVGVSPLEPLRWTISCPYPLVAITINPIYSQSVDSATKPKPPVKTDLNWKSIWTVGPQATTESKSSAAGKE